MAAEGSADCAAAREARLALAATASVKRDRDVITTVDL
jgi:hypothetical protein